MDRLQRQQTVTRIIDFYDAVNRAIGPGAEVATECLKQKRADVLQDSDG